MYSDDRKKRKSCRRIGHPRVLKPKPKHPLKLHIWGGISMKGATPLVLFRENLTAICLGKIFETGLIPFVRSKFPKSHSFKWITIPNIQATMSKKI